MMNGSTKPSTSMVLEMLRKPSVRKGTPNSEMVSAMATMRQKIKGMEGGKADRLQEILDEMEELTGTKEGEVI